MANLLHYISEPRKALFQQLTIYFVAIWVLIFLLPAEFDMRARTNDLLSTLVPKVHVAQTLPDEELPGAVSIECIATDGAQYLCTGLSAMSGGRTQMIAIDLVISILIVLLLVVPLSWVYRGTRKRSEVDQSIVETVIILPIVTVGVIMIVQDSLALAFSLAGIFAGVQFRSRLREIADTHYIFAAIGLSLACGTGAYGAAFVMAAAFSYGVYGFWRIGYASDSGERHIRLPDRKRENAAKPENDNPGGPDPEGSDA